MNTRAFVFLLAGVLALGASLGGAFSGGMALGRSQGEETDQNTQSTQSPFGIDQDQLSQLRQQFQSGDLDPQSLDGFRQDQFGQGFAGRGGLTGTIEGIQGDMLTVNTPLGPLQATIGERTMVQTFAEGTLADLLVGLQVSVTGQRGEDGVVVATTVLITPEGTGGLFGGRQLPGQ